MIATDGIQNRRKFITAIATGKLKPTQIKPLPPIADTSYLEACFEDEANIYIIDSKSAPLKQRKEVLRLYRSKYKKDANNT